MIVAASSPRPTTSPTAIMMRPSGRRWALCQSPPMCNVASAARYRERRAEQALLQLRGGGVLDFTGPRPSDRVADLIRGELEERALHVVERMLSEIEDLERANGA